VTDRPVAVSVSVTFSAPVILMCWLPCVGGDLLVLLVHRKVTSTVVPQACSVNGWLLTGCQSSPRAQAVDAGRSRSMVSRDTIRVVWHKDLPPHCRRTMHRRGNR
jgi:hypothetical protein